MSARLSVTLNSSWRRRLAAGDRRFWLMRTIAVRLEYGTYPRWVVEIFYKRLFLLMSFLTLAACAAAVGSLHYWLARNPHNRVSWSDIGLPWHWSGLRARLGDTAVLDARASLEKRDYHAAYLGLRVGVGRSPANAGGRLLLARLLAPAEPAQALELMEEGLRYSGSDLDFLRTLLDFYRFNQAFGRGVDVSDRLRAQTGPAAVSPEARALLGTARASLQLDAGQPAAALRSLAALAAGPPPSSDELCNRRLIEALALVRLAQAAKARPLLDELPTGPTDALRPDRWRAAAEVCLALGDADRLPDELRRLKAASPGDPASYIFAFECWHRLGRPFLRDAAEAEFYQVFGADDRAFQLFGATLVNLDLEDALLRVRARALAARLSAFAFDVQRTELFLRRGDFEQAVRSLRQWESGAVTLDPAQRFFPELLRRLTQVALDGNEQKSGALLDYLRENRPQVRPVVYSFVASVLDRAGLIQTEKGVLWLATAHYPYSEPLLAARLLHDEEKPSRKPPSRQADALDELPLRDDLADVLTSREATLRVLDEWLTAGRWLDAERLLGRMDRIEPEWLADARTDLRVRQVRLLLGTGQKTSALLIFRELVTPSGQPRFAAFALVRAYLARGERASARFLAEEVVRRLPGDSAAAKLRQETRAGAPPPER